MQEKTHEEKKSNSRQFECIFSPAQAAKGAAKEEKRAFRRIIFKKSFQKNELRYI